MTGPAYSNERDWLVGSPEVGGETAAPYETRFQKNSLEWFLPGESLPNI